MFLISIADEITEFHSYAVALIGLTAPVSLGEGAITLLLSKTLPGVEHQSRARTGRSMFLCDIWP